MNLLDCTLGEKYIITKIDTDDDELESFLFTLGCYEGQEIVVVSKIGESLVVSIRDGRYNINTELASTIFVNAI